MTWENAVEAAARVRVFLDARAAYRSRLDPQVERPSPNRIIAPYGYLDCDDLAVLVEAVLSASGPADG